MKHSGKKCHQTEVSTYEENQWSGHRSDPFGSEPQASIPSSSSSSHVPETRPPRSPNPRPSPRSWGPEAALTVGSELKLQELVAELALVTHVVTQIKVTLHGSQESNQTLPAKPHCRCLRPTLTFTRARGSDVKATPQALANRLARPASRKWGQVWRVARWK